MSITTKQVVNRLRLANYSFSRQGDRVEIHRQKGTGQRVSVPRCDLLDEKEVQVILRQAGLTPEQVEEFLKNAVKS